MVLNVSSPSSSYPERSVTIMIQDRAPSTVKKYATNPLPSIVKIFINVFAFLYGKANSKKICEERSFPSFFLENANVSTFAEIQD